MNIRDELLADPKFSKYKASIIAAHAALSAANFKELMHCFLADHYRLAQRAAYSVSIASSGNTALIAPYIGVLVSQLKRTDVHDAVVRNSARILQNVTIPDEFHGELMDACFTLIQNRSIPIAIRVFSLTSLFNLSGVYPEIRKELRVIIEESMDYEKPAFRSRAKKILAKI